MTPLNKREEFSYILLIYVNFTFEIFLYGPIQRQISSSHCLTLLTHLCTLCKRGFTPLLCLYSLIIHEILPLKFAPVYLSETCG